MDWYGRNSIEYVDHLSLSLSHEEWFSLEDIELGEAVLQSQIKNFCSNISHWHDCTVTVGINKEKLWQTYLTEGEWRVHGTSAVSRIAEFIIFRME